MNIFYIGQEKNISLISHQNKSKLLEGNRMKCLSPRGLGGGMHILSMNSTFSENSLQKLKTFFNNLKLK